MALLERLARTARSWRRIASLKTLTRAPSRDVPPHYYLLQGLLGAGAGWHVTGVLLGTTYDDDEESQKLALSESTGLDRKQINIWFINQRKRHWKPSEDMQFVVIDATYPHYYMDNVLSNPFPTERSPHISLKTEPWIHRRRPDKLEGQLHLICKLS